VNQKLPKKFYLQNDVVSLAQKLLGKVLCTHILGNFTSGIITETEAYAGMGDRACHAYGGKKTNRNQIMYENGGLAYVYLCYGLHHLFNVVTNQKGQADAILIRAIIPLDGIDVIKQRRKVKTKLPPYLSGPGVVTSALGINLGHYGKNLRGNEIWIEDRKIEIAQENIKIGPRIGIDYAGADAKLPWRFVYNLKF